MVCFSLLFLLAASFMFLGFLGGGLILRLASSLADVPPALTHECGTSFSGSPDRGPLWYVAFRSALIQDLESDNTRFSQVTVCSSDAQKGHEVLLTFFRLHRHE